MRVTSSPNDGLPDEYNINFADLSLQKVRQSMSTAVRFMPTYPILAYSLVETTAATFFLALDDENKVRM